MASRNRPSSVRQSQRQAHGRRVLRRRTRIGIIIGALRDWFAVPAPSVAGTAIYVGAAA
jgi:hypothetical protein